MKNTIEVNGTVYPIRFGYGAIKKMGRLFEKDSYDDVVAEINKVIVYFASLEERLKAEQQKDAEALSYEGVKMPFDVLDILGGIFQAGIMYANEDEAPELGNIVDAILSDPKTAQAPLMELIEKLPKAKMPEKKTPKPKQGKAPAKR
jgi:hypothetical protein